MRHQIIWKYRDGTSPEAQSELETKLLALAHNDASGNVNTADLGISHASIEKYDSQEGLNQGYTHAATFVFLSGAHRDAYLVHQRHTDFLGYLGSVNIIEKFIAFDASPPVTPRRVMQQTEHVLAEEKSDTLLPRLKILQEHLRLLLQIMNHNPSAFKLILDGKEVGSRAATYTKASGLFNLVTEAISNHSSDASAVSNSVARLT